MRAWTEAGERAAFAARNPDDPANGDPELKGLDQRVAAKLRAVAQRQPVPVADLGEGVVAPEPIEPADDAGDAAAGPEKASETLDPEQPSVPASDPADPALKPAADAAANDAEGLP